MLETELLGAISSQEKTNDPWEAVND